MITFGEIVRKDTTVSYVKNDCVDYTVVGHASYNKENTLVSAYGEIKDTEEVIIAHLTIYGGEGTEGFKTNITDIASGKFDLVAKAVDEIVDDLVLGYNE